LRKSGDAAGALAHAQKALELSQQLSTEDPGNIEIVSDVANCHFKLAQVLDKRDALAALGHAMKSIALLDGLLAHTQDSNLVGMRIRADLAAGGIELHLDRSLAALGHYRQAAIAAAQSGGKTDLARSQAGAANANERLHRWTTALDDYRSAQKTWFELRRLNELAPEDSNEPDRMAVGLAHCRRGLLSELVRLHGRAPAYR
jgi:tetratricopeptide (TPR) repeat protein